MLDATRNRLDGAHEEPMVPLMFLRAGQSAEVGAVLGGSDLVHRLRELGLRSGAEVQMVRPGTPCLIRLGGQKLGIRADELANVLVRPRVAVPC
jgi:ferrous iron transport protein A